MRTADRTAEQPARQRNRGAPADDGGKGQRVSDIVVRRAQPDELDSVGELTVAAYAEDGFLDDEAGRAYTRSLRDARRRAEHGELYVAVDDRADLLGTATLALPDTALAEMCADGEAELRMVGVAPHARGRGVGEALTRAAIDRARELEAHRMVLCSLTTMTAAHRLYERLGFVRTPARDWVPASGVSLIAYTLAL